MKKVMLVVDQADRSRLDADLVTTADDYLAGKDESLDEGVHVVNLCRSYQYLSKGYYVSLLADARRQHVLPTLEMVEDIMNPFAYFQVLRAAGIKTIDFRVLRGRRRLLPRVILPESDATPNGKGEPLVIPGSPGSETRYEPGIAGYVDTMCVVGKALDERFARACAAVFRVYAFPILRVRMYQDGDEWCVGQIIPGSPSQLTPEELELLNERVRGREWNGHSARTAVQVPHHIACLWEESDALQPSDDKTLGRFARAATRQGALLVTIGKEDLPRLAEYDALFIRTVTAIEHYSFRFAQTAESLGMPVIDDPQSMMKCSNKVYLHELFRRSGIATPLTRTISRKSPVEQVAALGFPVILKVPDGSFSQSVKKADDEPALVRLLAALFERTPLLVAQAYVPTAFDWRITTLEKKVLFACKYHMAKDHWQIARRFDSGFTRYGKVEAVPIASVPEAVARIAIEAVSPIGDSLYGVDVKETADGPLVIEVNDNPNIEAGYEDAVEGDRIYDEIIGFFLRRIEAAARVTERA
jgi:glutathione synthase/RimK-type ligase-like ATP-grasp enzyme